MKREYDEIESLFFFYSSDEWHKRNGLIGKFSLAIKIKFLYFAKEDFLKLLIIYLNLIKNALEQIAFFCF